MTRLRTGNRRALIAERKAARRRAGWLDQFNYGRNGMSPQVPKEWLVIKIGVIGFRGGRSIVGVRDRTNHRPTQERLWREADEAAKAFDRGLLYHPEKYVYQSQGS